jgi:hypothetical protein
MLAILDPTAQLVIYLLAIVLFVSGGALAWSGQPERGVACVAFALALAFIPTAWNLTDAL